ncbi:MAG: TVP38/TMEM64 family protein [Oscillospiraceae bacterium]
MNITEKNKKIIKGILCILLFVAITAVVFIFAGKPIMNLVKNPEQLREWVEQRGFLGKLAFIGMMTVQIMVAIIPGEPLEIAAGYAFGFFEGTLLCLIGGFIGSLLIFLFVRYFGIKVVELFFSREKIQSLSFLKDAKKLNMLTFILFTIPGTPKDIISYCIGLTKMKLSTWLIISTLGRIPSIITSTIGGNALGSKNYTFAIIVFACTIIISAIGLIIYQKLVDKKPKPENENLHIKK